MKDRERIIKAIRLTWDSLDSHLDWSTEEKVENPCKYCGGRKFHARCTRDYAFVIQVLTEQL